MYQKRSKKWSELFTLPKQNPVITEKKYLNCFDLVEKARKAVMLRALQSYRQGPVLGPLRSQKKNSLKNTYQVHKNFFFASDHKFRRLLKQLEEKRHKRQIFLRSLTLASILDEFPLYFRNKMDYRTRMYPYQHLLSRTTGFYKHLLMDYNGIKLTVPGFINLLRAYYVLDSDLLNKFETHIIKQNVKIKNAVIVSLKNFYDTNKLNLLGINVKMPYFILLKHNIESIFLKGLKHKIHISLELDQNASGIVFVALLFKNKALASQCNLLVKSRQDVYTFVKDRVKSYLLSEQYSKKSAIKNKATNGLIAKKSGLKVFQFCGFVKNFLVSVL